MPFWITVLWVSGTHTKTHPHSMEWRGQAVCFSKSVNISYNSCETANSQTQNWQKYAKLSNRLLPSTL